VAARNKTGRLSHGRAHREWPRQLLTRTGLNWTEKYPSAIAAFANLNVKSAYIDGRRVA
jgi:ATP-dependent DNA ligase